MKVLVTGAGGFIGSAVVERLLAHGERDIRCFLRPGGSQAKLDQLASKFPDARLEYCIGNLALQSDAARAVEQVSVVYHLAAALKGSHSDIFLNTVVSSKNIVEAIGSRKPMRVILVSSFGVYGVSKLPRGSVVNEASPIEPYPEKRDPYSYAKWREEMLFKEYQQRYGFELVILRPGVVYGPGAGPFSARVGLQLIPGLLLQMGGRNLLPLSYVTNCAEAIVIAGRKPDATGEVYNVHDDDLPTARFYLQQYKRRVRKLRSITIPYGFTLMLSGLVEWYHRYSRGQLPAALTPYMSAALWAGNRFDNSKLKQLGWSQLISTADAMDRTFNHLRHECANSTRNP